MSNQRRYEEGLRGEKPNSLTQEFDQEGYNSQLAGYQKYLGNQDLVKQIIEANQIAAGTYEGGGDSGPRTEFPITFGARIFLTLFGLGFGVGAIAFVYNVFDYESTYQPRNPSDVLGNHMELTARLVGDSVIFFLLAWCSYRILKYALSKNSKT